MLRRTDCHCQARPEELGPDGRMYAAHVSRLLQGGVTGKKPFDGDSDFAVMSATAHGDFVARTSFNPGLPAGIDAVVAKALAKDRSRRYASAGNLSQALLALK